jgi:hypothetical protein
MKKFIGIVLLALLFAVVLFTVQVFAANNDNNYTYSDNNSTTFALQKRVARLDWKLDIKIAQGNGAIKAINDYNSSIDTSKLTSDVSSLQSIRSETSNITTQAGFVIEKQKASTAIRQLNKDLMSFVPRGHMKQIKKDFLTHKKQIMQDWKDRFHEMNQMHKQEIQNRMGRK